MSAKRQPPVVELGANDALMEFYTDTHGDRWDVARLVEDTQHLESFDCPLASLDLSHAIWRDADMFTLARHAKKLLEADFTYPIIIAWDGSIADGRHRVLKALALGHRTIKAVRMHWKPEPSRRADDA